MSTCTVCELHAESTFKIEGMDCHEEVAILERRLKRLTGLEALDADVIGQRLRIKYDAAKLSTGSIAEAVAQTGMRAWLEHEEPAPATASATSRLRLLVLSGIAFALGVAASWLGAPGSAIWIPFVSSIALGGVHTGRRAIASLRAGILDINVLMVIAVAGAIALGEWTEAASVVFLFALAQLLETRAMDRARGAIRALMDLAPAEAIVRRNGHEQRMPVDDVRVGDTILVGPGEKLPLDGRVVAGDSYVNQAPVTGESLPIEKVAGDDVFAGTINGRGALDVEVTRLRRDSTLARIIHLVERAQAQRAPSQTFVDRFARFYTPAVLAIAVIVALAPPLIFGASWSVWVYRSLVLLVISCPCALVISTPVSIVSALAAAARKGVLIKGGAHLERMASIRCIAFDKTGTLTHGRLHVVDVLPMEGVDRSEVLRLAASLEMRSEHPIGKAIVAYAVSAGIRPVSVDSFQAIPGRGAEGQFGVHRLVVGSHRLFEERGLCSASMPMIGLEDGWYEPEYNPRTTRSWRWTAEKATLWVRPIGRNVALTLSGESPLKYYDAAPNVTVVVGGREVARFTPSADFTQEIVLPADALAAADGRVVFTCDKFFVPAQRDGSMDQRHLALRMYGYSVR